MEINNRRLASRPIESSVRQSPLGLMAASGAAVQMEDYSCAIRKIIQHKNDSQRRTEETLNEPEEVKHCWELKTNDQIRSKK